MYRVELKEGKYVLITLTLKRFLMYRVELKVFKELDEGYGLVLVPNVPCGVESFQRTG